ncbi:Intraflagellar transport protein 46 [Perkinsus olseni]|uniref:Intraflagellar transport protein 46 n=1 Tax=Perkinsus olseni TaxID=32597 RepID=A0A7J6NST4_PEROL|nr:Intraflagellar transport protein 46 [Perkinsus olseni]
MPPGTKEILQNREVIAVDQDPLGKMGCPIFVNTSNVRVWIKELSPEGVKARWATVLRNFLTENVTLKIDATKIPGWNSGTRFTVRDLFAHEDLGQSYTSSVDFPVAPQSVRMFLLTEQGEGEPSEFTTSNSRRVIDNRPYDEVFDVLQGDHPIDDEEEEEEINSDVEVQGSPQDKEPHASHYESGEDSVSTPRSSRGSDEARDVSPKFSPDEITGPLGSSTEVAVLESRNFTTGSPPSRETAQAAAPSAGSVIPEADQSRKVPVPSVQKVEHDQRSAESSSSSASSSSSGLRTVENAGVRLRSSSSSAGDSPPGAGVKPQPSMTHKLVRGSVDPPTTRGYRAEDFANLNVSDEIKDLFGYIGRYNPHTVELETRLKPFIPDLIPAVGEVDAALKIPPPSVGLRGGSRGEGPDTGVGVTDVMSKLNGLGLVELDEPSLSQSDPAVVQLKLRSVTQCGKVDSLRVRRVPYPETINQREVDNWVSQIEELHEEGATTSSVMNYSHKMPSIDRLMQAWPPEMEEYLSSTAALPDPSPDLDVDLVTYIRIICAMLDIPVHDNSTASIIEALHMLFSLYLDFTSNPHFATPPSDGVDDVPSGETKEGRASIMIG